MAGGIGSRFWPSSRIHRPKQFLDILGIGKSLLQLTVDRFLNLCPQENIFIVTNLQYKEQILEQIPGLAAAQVLTEPSRNNTAPCITYAAMRIRKMNPNANFIVAPSDHIIVKEIAFIERVKQGLEFVAENEALLTLGIQPTHPNTGYGYIHYDKTATTAIAPVIKFTEKPVLDKAKAFLESGDYLWNAGIFIWNANTLLKALEKYAPEVYSILNEGEEHWLTASEQTFLNERYPATPNISIDYAIMEKAENIFTLPADIGWSDLGTWASLHEQMDKDENKNAVSAPAQELVQLKETTNCMVRVPKDKLVVIRGLEDYIVVDEDNVLLIYPKSEEQAIKQENKATAELFNNKFS